jgi:hypothetical protein
MHTIISVACSFALEDLSAALVSIASQDNCLITGHFNCPVVYRWASYGQLLPFLKDTRGQNSALATVILVRLWDLCLPHPESAYDVLKIGRGVGLTCARLQSRKKCEDAMHQFSSSLDIYLSQCETPILICLLPPPHFEIPCIAEGKCNCSDNTADSTLPPDAPSCRLVNWKTLHLQLAQKYSQFPASRILFKDWLALLYPPLDVSRDPQNAPPAHPWYDALRDRLAHSPFPAAFTSRIATAVHEHVLRLSAWAQLQGKKVLVLDCDNTLWGGAVSELGPTGVPCVITYSVLAAQLDECI